MSKCYIEKLYHFNCSCGTWWTLADAKLTEGQTVYCSKCGTPQTISEFEIGEDQLTASPASSDVTVLQSLLPLDVEMPSPLKLLE